VTTFTAWKFESPEGADRAAQVLRQVSSEGLMKLEDYAVIEWPAGADKPDVKYENRDDARGAGWGALIGVLVGTLFFLPLIGAAAGAAIGVLSKRVEAIGISKSQLDSIGKEVTPGTSALFVVTQDSDRDRVAERFHGLGATLITSNLVNGEEDDVRRAIED